MELPEDVLRLVKEYSMPITRPDWRTLHKMTKHRFKTDCYITTISNRNKITVFRDWWYKYMYRQTFPY